MEIIRVKAAAGLKVPYEFKANQFITDEAVEVPKTIYYRRRLLDGDLVEVESQVKSDDKKGGK